MKRKSPFTDLLKNEKLTKDSYLFNIEHSRLTEDLLFFSFEVFNSQKKSIFRIKIQIDITEPLKNIPIGKSINKVGLVNLSSKSLFEMFKDGVGNAITEGRFPYFPGG